MKRSIFILFVTVLLILLSVACENQTTSQSIIITAEAVKMDEHFDSLPCDEAKAVLAPYKRINDSIMSVVVGLSEMEMTKGSPQSLLSNLSADMLYLSSMMFLGEQADFSLFNMGGIRGDMPKGNVTKGDLYSIYSFDNHLVILEIQGKYLRELFQFFGEEAFQPIGGSIQLIYGKENTFKEALIHDKPLDNDKIYKVITIDFLAAGGDNMTMLSNAKSMKTYELTLREVMMQIFEMNYKKGVPITSKLDQRIIIENQ